MSLTHKELWWDCRKKYVNCDSLMWFTGSFMIHLQYIELNLFYTVEKTGVCSETLEGVINDSIFPLPQVPMWFDLVRMSVNIKKSIST